MPASEEKMDGGDLASILKRAMRDMRDHLGEDSKEESDDDWSDVE